jgi:hypothetical protein
MKKILLYLILVMAVGMAGIVAYVSVGGLLKVFSGAGTLGLLFFSSIEIAKIVATSAIHTYGKKIGFIYNALLSLGIGIAMLITSIGIYGFLSSTYKETFMKLENVEAQASVLIKQRDAVQKQIDNIDKEKEIINRSISELNSGLSNNIVQYKDSKTGQIITNTSQSKNKSIGKQLVDNRDRLNKIELKSDELNTKLFDLDNKITEVNMGNDSAAELGPLKYLSEVTGKSMDEVMKYFIFLLIIIGDPMAVLMVIVFNKVVRSEEEPTVEVKKPWLDNIKNLITNSKNITPMVVEEIIPDESNGDDNTIITKEDIEAIEPIDKNLIDTLIANTYNVSITEATKQENEAPIQEAYIEEPDVIEETLKEIAKKEVLKEIDIDENKETRERGFSVLVPNRRTNHSVDRIGSNKEIRDKNSDTLFFKRNR